MVKHGLDRLQQRVYGFCMGSIGVSMGSIGFSMGFRWLSMGFTGFAWCLRVQHGVYGFYMVSMGSAWVLEGSA